MVAQALALTAAVLFSGASSARFTQRRAAQQQKAAGAVDQLVTFGAPAVSDPAMENRRGGSKCFPGARVWNSFQHGYPSYGSSVDIVTTIAYAVGFRHPFVEGVGFVRNERKENKVRCDRATRQPSGSAETWLHMQNRYIESAEELASDPSVVTTAEMACNFIYNEEPAEVKKEVEAFGWKLIGQAFDDGKGELRSGPQPAYLMQEPSTKECILGFQGSNAFGDWMSNLHVVKADFCGMPEKFHKGFRDHLRRIVRNETFQSDIRPKLPGCSKVTVTGHSLGGAMASLFTGCVQAAPSASDDVDGDYAFLSW